MPNREIIFLVQKSHEGGHEASALGHSIFTHAETLDELKRNVEDAVRYHFNDEETPRNVRLVEAQPQRIFGSEKGEFVVPDDFNDPLTKEIEDLFYN